MIGMNSSVLDWIDRDGDEDGNFEAQEMAEFRRLEGGKATEGQTLS